jgi:hypothetical protein
VQQALTVTKLPDASSPAAQTNFHQAKSSETRQGLQLADSVSSTKTTSSLHYWEKLQKCQTYKDVQQVSLETILPSLPHLLQVTFLTHKRVVDNSALHLLPNEIQSLGLLPTTIYGDGDCLARCGSLLVYGHEENHLDIRARIIQELVVNEEKYLDDKFLNEGSDPCLEKKNFASQFAMFSEHFTGEKLTYLAIQRIYQAEVCGLCHSGSYMGIWQVAALSNVLQSCVVSVYPQYGGQTVRSDLNRTFLPFQKTETNKSKVYIMWSNIQGNRLTEKEWHPNHFVLLIKMYPDEDDSLITVEKR